MYFNHSSCKRLRTISSRHIEYMYYFEKIFMNCNCEAKHVEYYEAASLSAQIILNENDRRNKTQSNPMRLRIIEKKWDMTTQNIEHRIILAHEFVSLYMRFFIRNCFLLFTYIYIICWRIRHNWPILLGEIAKCDILQKSILFSFLLCDKLKNSRPVKMHRTEASLSEQVIYK